MARSGDPATQEYADAVAVLGLEPWRTDNRTYFRMAELGIIDPDERVELLDGVVTPMSPKNPPHENVKAYLNRLVIVSVEPSLQMRIEAPLPLAEGWVPEPDLALAPSPAPSAGHPVSAVWVCEVADTTLRRDRDVKRQAYAAGGVPELWIVDVNAPSVEVFRRPEGGDYREHAIVSSGVLASSAVTGLAVDLDRLWRETLG
jgi:Uma2 family endonuclease